MSARGVLPARHVLALAAAAVVLAPLVAPARGALLAQAVPWARGGGSGPIHGGELVLGFGRSASLAPLLRMDRVDFRRGEAWALSGRLGGYLGNRLSLGVYAGWTGSRFTASVDGSDAPGTSMPLLLVGGDAMVHVLPRTARWAPFVVGGLGMKLYSPEGEHVERRFSWNAGAGLDLGLSSVLGLRLEARDHMSTYHPGVASATLQHDVFLTAGLRYRL